ncbi:hypothetical protein GCM10010174_80570 [Kutzneria viridogrisea]|uniref:Pentapeptide repeat-containing protein n=1 Tax=Kutzneria viridogrisea TaxID=47990 RepID=A0ABR6BYY7_9PSEU|nr:hypothetical protein [Kutzneria viridogrisea]
MPETTDTEDPPPPNPPEPTGLPALPRGLVPIVVTTVLVVSGLLLLALLWWLDTGEHLDPRDHATARLDAVKIALSVAAGGGALFALWLGVRRQRTSEHDLRLRDRAQAHTEAVAAQNQLHQERVAAATERDAEARRVTELYSKSIEQLGSAQAPVRLGGLYALERLAQDNPGQRQTIANVFCAYLRMPFDLPNDPPEDATEQQVGDGHNEQLEQDDAHRDRVQEREVRLTAQRILTSHLYPGTGEKPPETFWPDLHLDLTGATLINFSLGGCHLGSARFERTRFHGFAVFERAHFHRIAVFGEARFHGFAHFSRAHFHHSGLFDRAWFHGVAAFDTAQFDGRARFCWAQFHDVATFAQTRFDGKVPVEWAEFDAAQFHANVKFEVWQFTPTPITLSGAPIWIRLDIPAFDRTLPTGCVVRPVDQKPYGVAEGRWGHLVHEDTGPAATPDPDQGETG